MIAIRGARLVDARGERAGDVVIDGDRIKAVVAPGTPVAADTILDGTGYALIPGFVNTHTHAAMGLLRGKAGDLALHDWLQQEIWPREKYLNADHVFAGTRLGCLELLTSGTTSFNDMYFFGAAVARAVVSLGMRAVVAQVFFNAFDTPPRDRGKMVADLEEGLSGLQGFARVTPSIGPHAPYTVSLDGLESVVEVANRHGSMIHLHLAETAREMTTFQNQHGHGVVPALEAMGMLSPRLVAAHGIFLEPEDIETLARGGARISHCPMSNMKLAVGAARPMPRVLPWRRLHDAGVNVSLGTDGAASGELDMFHAMRIAALLQKHSQGDATAITARDVFAMATINGAQALGIEAGLIEPGLLADLVLIDLARPCFVPGIDLISDLVYAARADCVDTVMVGGRVVLRGGRHPDARSILAEARVASQDLRARAEADLTQN